MKSHPLKAIVASRNFNPGHYSHLVATYKLLEEHGVNTFMFHHSLFNSMGDIKKNKICNNIFELKALGRVDLAIFWSPSLKNIVDIIFLRFFHGTNVVYFFHEPLEAFNTYRMAGFSLIKTINIYLVGQVNLLLVLLSDRIALPSKKAMRIFESNYSYTNKIFAYFPLMLDDEAAHINISCQRPFISYIGTIAEDHAFDEFLDLVHHSIENDWFPIHKFLIATKSSLSTAQRTSLLCYVDSGRLVIEDGKVMSNDVINNHYNSSIVVWNAYRRSMQSGVLAKAFMFGTPLIVSSCNTGELFDVRQNGFVVSAEYDLLELKAAIDDIILNFEKYSAYCRNTFLTKLSYKSYKKSFIDFVFNLKENKYE